MVIAPKNLGALVLGILLPLTLLGAWFAMFEPRIRAQETLNESRVFERMHDVAIIMIDKKLATEEEYDQMRSNFELPPQVFEASISFDGRRHFLLGGRALIGTDRKEAHRRLHNFRENRSYDGIGYSLKAIVAE